MAAGVNKVILIGNLGADPEQRQTPSGTPVTSFRIAVDTHTKDKPAQWFRVVAWDKLANFSGDYLKKGDCIFIEGELQNRSWQDKNGVTHYTTEIVAKNIQKLSLKRELNRDEKESEDEFPADEVPFSR